MKNLANCTPHEFFAQTLKIRKAMKFLKDDEISEIMRRKPIITDDMAVEDKRLARSKQTNANLGDLFEVLAEKHPEETLNLLALMCFVEPEDIDNNKMDAYLESLAEMMGSDAVIRFFISYVRLARSGILNL